MYISDAELKMEFSKRLRKELRRNAMTQSELAEIAEISRVQINYYVRGKMLPSFYNLMKIVSALGCSMEEFNCL